MSHARINMRTLPICLLALVVLLPAAQARINVTTLPGRDTVQLTVYNSADLTMVKETRTLVLRKGLNRLEFSWANTLIDPTSVEFRALTHADEVDVLDVSFPPRVAETLEWRVHSEFAGEAQVEIRYFTSGISWAADYAAEAARDEKAMSLSGWVRVNNHSGEDYENAQVRLVVGVVRLVEEIAKLAKKDQSDGKVPVDKLAQVVTRQRALAVMDGALSKSESRRGEIIKEEMSEYFLYTVEGRDTIPNGWSKRMPSFQATGVPVTSYYKFEKERWGDAVLRHYRFTNSVPSRLGQEPLPDGAVKAFRLASEDGLYQYVGATQVKYIPIKETVELELGNDPEVMIKPRADGLAEAGHQVRPAWQRERLDHQGDLAVRGAELQGNRGGAGHPAELQGRLVAGDRSGARESGCEQGEVHRAAQTAREADFQL